MQEKIKNLDGQEVSFVTQITLENGKVYTLYSDGNLYEEVEGKGFVPLKKLNKENKKIISRFIEKVKPEKTDVIKNNRRRKKEPIIEIEEL